MFTCNKNYSPGLTFQILSLTTSTFVFVLTSSEMDIILDSPGDFPALSPMAKHQSWSWALLSKFVWMINNHEHLTIAQSDGK